MIATAARRGRAARCASARSWCSRRNRHPRSRGRREQHQDQQRHAPEHQLLPGIVACRPRAAFSSSLASTRRIAPSSACRRGSTNCSGRSGRTAPSEADQQHARRTRDGSRAYSWPPPNRSVRKNSDGWNSAMPRQRQQDQAARGDPVIDARRGRVARELSRAAVSCVAALQHVARRCASSSGCTSFGPATIQCMKPTTAANAMPAMRDRLHHALPEPAPAG